MPRMTDPEKADRAARLEAESTERRTNVGTLAILVALVIVVVQAFGSGAEQWPNLLAVLLAVIGAGLRVEGALLRRKG